MNVLVNNMLPLLSRIEYPVKVNPSTQRKEIFSLCTNNKNYQKVLPKNWGDRVAGFLSERIPYCSIKFKPHKLYSKCSKFVAKFWFRCGIAGCSINGTAVLDKNMILHVKNMGTSLRHIKGQVKSFRSRFVRGDNRLKLGKTASELAFPSKVS